jgi:UDP-N-acetylglucosamine transferase subunit ALG13
MIFVTVGTTEFDGLIKEMDLIAPTLHEPVVMQVGHGTVRPAHAAEWFPYAHSLESYYRQASVVVSHGGLGTLVEVLRAGGRLVGVSNPQLYDRHQEDLLATFEKDGYLVWCRELARLPEALDTARVAYFRPYQPPSCTLHQEIAAVLSQPNRSSWWQRLTQHG